VLPDPAQPFPTSPLYLRPDDTQWSHQSIRAVARIQSKVVEKRIRLREFFQDFDALRKGLCSVGNLRSALTISNLGKELSKSDFEELVNTYAQEDGQFNYLQFCNDVNQAFAVTGLEKMPLFRAEMPDAETTSPARRNSMRLGDGTRSKIASVEDRIRTQVQKNGIHLKPLFDDFDRAHRGFVTRSQFTRVMSTINLPQHEDTVGCLAGKYCDFGNHCDFNYKTFLKSVDPPKDDVEVAMMEMTSPHIPFRPRPYFDDRKRVIPRSNSSPMLSSM